MEYRTSVIVEKIKETTKTRQLEIWKTVIKQTSKKWETKYQRKPLNGQEKLLKSSQLTLDQDQEFEDEWALQLLGRVVQTEIVNVKTGKRT